MPDCVFCKIVAGEEPANFVEKGRGYVAFSPHRPHTPGHVMFVPDVHVADAAANPLVSAATFAAAAVYVRDVVKGSANIITSVGEDATQSVFHLHVHVVPRGPEDGIRRSWPWRLKVGEVEVPVEKTISNH